MKINSIFSVVNYTSKLGTKIVPFTTYYNVNNPYIQSIVFIKGQRIITLNIPRITWVCKNEVVNSPIEGLDRYLDELEYRYMENFGTEKEDYNLSNNVHNFHNSTLYEKYITELIHRE